MTDNEQRAHDLAVAFSKHIIDASTKERIKNLERHPNEGYTALSDYEKELLMIKAYNTMYKTALESL